MKFHFLKAPTRIEANDYFLIKEGLLF